MNSLSYLFDRTLGFRSRFCFNDAFKNFRATSDDCLEFDQISLETPCYAGSYCSPTIGSKLALGLEDGVLGICDTSVEKYCDFPFSLKWQAHNNAIFDVKWCADSNSLATASGDTTIAVWDVEEKQRNYVFTGHKSSVKSVSFQPLSKDVLCSSSRDGSIIIWDSRIFKKGCNQCPDILIENAHEEQIDTPKTKKRRVIPEFGINPRNSVTKAEFQTDYKVVSVGACDRAIKIWDIRRIKKHNNKAIPSMEIIPQSNKELIGFTSFTLNKTCSEAFVSSYNSGIFHMNLLSYSNTPIKIYTGHQGNSNYCRTNLSPDSRFLVSGSLDYKVYMWEVNQSSEPLLCLEGHTNEVTTVLWHPTKMDEIISLSDDFRSLRWKIGLLNDKNEVGRAKIFDKCPNDVREKRTLSNHIPEEIVASRHTNDENFGAIRHLNFSTPEKIRVLAARPLEPTNATSFSEASTSQQISSPSTPKRKDKGKPSAKLITNYFSPK